MDGQDVKENILVSNHFDEELISSLQEEYVQPYKDEVEKVLQTNHGSLKPRRVVGHYVTFLVKDENATFSVMVKKDAQKYKLQCDCEAFHQDNRCVHIAAVLDSVSKQIRNEKMLSEHKTIEEKFRKNTFDSEHENQHPIKQHESFHVLKSFNKPTQPTNLSGSPYIILNARDFSIYRLASLLPSLRNVSLRNKSFVKIKTQSKGFDLHYQHHKEKQIIFFRVNQNDDLEIKCSCEKTNIHHLCHHGLDSIYYLTETGSFSQFIPFTNQSNEKNLLLADFGLTLEDEEAKNFKYSVDYNGRLTITNIPKHFASYTNIQKIEESLKIKKHLKKTFKFKDEVFDIGLLFLLSHEPHANAPVKIEALKSNAHKNGDDKLNRILIGKEENQKLFTEMDERQYAALMAFSYLNFKDFIGVNSFLPSYTNFTNHYFETTKNLYLKYFFEQLEKYWSELSRWKIVKLLLNGQTFSKSNLIDIELSTDHLLPSIKVSSDTKFITLKLIFHNQNGHEVIGEEDDVEIYFGRILLYHQRLYLLKAADHQELLLNMPYGKLLFPATFSDKVIRGILYPLQKRYDINIPEDIKMHVKEVPLRPIVLVSEVKNQYLKISLRFGYEDIIIEMGDEQDYFFENEENRPFLIRNTADENNFVDFIKSTHPFFQRQITQSEFLLPVDEVMKNKWFITFYKTLLDQDIKIEGYQDLKRFKFNSASPVWDMKISSGIDWFDVQITASWGDQVLSYKEIRKAILQGQDYVLLEDGSYGNLPDEWIQKYSKLLKFSVEAGEGIKVSKKHFNIVEMLFEQIDEQEILEELRLKKQNLLMIDRVKVRDIPSVIDATLRPYQIAGYQWMQVLDEISWGGCLADDMGLGKTLQAITFLAYVKERYHQPTSLIICPTSLIFNWENEIKKFAPSLRYHLFYGMDRTLTPENFKTFDIIISSYGIVRNDIDTLTKFQWEYVILDESQAIKNPDAISTKAVQLLNARNRFILSGTPLQNNTFDIYSQFNFLNPGLLGGKEFFKQEFANPIDKTNDKDASLLLRNLIKPFMLRRTKAEVAPDLPEKTETILWCQMDKAQQTLYDDYKNYYRSALLQKIEEEGMAKSGVYILEGLLRLRQICDDPRLIKDQEVHPKKGIKIQELLREVKENIGQHKILVFSQFTEMLALIKEELDENKIAYCYLDGSTPAIKRKEQVEMFQNEQEVHIFLISLKAGGVGLNLTEADYVYIVDPWWNPAVEQQAIDRTHRLGQKNKIFAYKMICKDSVEEKIIILQEKKRTISQEIVQEDATFFKNLTKEDIGYLFS